MPKAPRVFFLKMVEGIMEMYNLPHPGEMFMELMGNLSVTQLAEYFGRSDQTVII